MKKFLIIRFSSIGDIVLTTPIVRCLRTQYPDAEIHYITKKVFAGILKSNPNIDKVWTINQDVSEIKKELQQEGFTHVIDLHKNLRSKQVKSIVGGKYSTFSKLNLEKFLLTKLKINKLPKIHIVDRYFDAVSELNVKNDARGLDYHFENSFQFNFDLPESFIAIAVGTAVFTKSMTVEKLVKICNSIQLPIVLIGGKADKKKAQEVVEKANKDILNLCGKCSFDESAYVIKSAKTLISGDTGMMHIASAFDTQIISVWGNTVPDFGMYPYKPQNREKFSIVEVPNLSCRPCSKIGYKKCPKGHFKCINDISIDEVVSKLNLPSA